MNRRTNTIVGAMMIATTPLGAHASTILEPSWHAPRFLTVDGLSAGSAAESHVKDLSSTLKDPDKVHSSGVAEIGMSSTLFSDVLDVPPNSNQEIIPIVNQTNAPRSNPRFSSEDLNLSSDTVYFSDNFSSRNYSHNNLEGIKQKYLENTLDDIADNSFIVSMVRAGYRIYSLLISSSSPIANFGTLSLIGLSLAGLSYLGRRRRTK